MPSPSNLANDDMTLPELAAAFPPVIVAASPVTVPDDLDDDSEEDTPVFVPRSGQDER